MKSKNHVGKLSHAPLVMTLASLQIQPVLSFDEYVPKIQDSLRDEYPGGGTIQQKVMQIDALDSGSPKTTHRTMTRLLMSSPDRQWLAQANENVISLMTTANYNDFDEFEARFRHVLKVICGVMRIKFFNRLGFRQIDNVTNFKGMAISEQVESSIQMPSTALGSPLSESRIESVYRTEEGMMVLRCIQIPSQVTVPVLPFDFNDTSSFLNSPVTERVMDGGVLVLDIDHYKQYADLTAYDEVTVLKSLRQLHKTSRDMFFNCVTEDAIKAWQ